MRKSIALAAGWALVCAAVVLAVEVDMMSRAEMEAQHYGRLWAQANAAHVHTSSSGEKTWRCCRVCVSSTFPFLHEAFEESADTAPKMPAAPPAQAAPAAAGGAKKFFMLTETDSASHGHAKTGAALHTKGSASHFGATRKDTEFAIMQRRKLIAQADALAGRRVDSTAYSCCNMCPDLMYPFPGTWNRPSPYSYPPPRRFRFAAKGQSALVETAAKTKAAIGAATGASAEATSEQRGKDKYEWTNPHNLPHYYYYESTQKAAPARSPAARDGRWSPPMRPGASPVWHPPPPPHDDIFRMSRSPNLHDGTDLSTPPFLPPCCDFCMSTYLPHIINDEWQLPKKEPYTISPFSKAGAFLAVDEHIGAEAEAETGSETATEAEAETETDAEMESESEVEEQKKNKRRLWSKNDRENAITSAQAAAEFSVQAKSDPATCCHKCVRKDIEDTDWRIYALPPGKQ